MGREWVNLHTNRYYKITSCRDLHFVWISLRMAHAASTFFSITSGVSSVACLALAGRSAWMVSNLTSSVTISGRASVQDTTRKQVLTLSSAMFRPWSFVYVFKQLSKHPTRKLYTPYDFHHMCSMGRCVKGMRFTWKRGFRHVTLMLDTYARLSASTHPQPSRQWAWTFWAEPNAGKASQKI